MIITVFSGKGGTGKTTISTNLFSVLRDSSGVQLVDTDVEEPNTHIFFDVSFSEQRPVELLVPKIDDAKCTRCGICAQECQFGAIAIGKNSSVVFATMCHGCGVCKMVCPEYAITEVPRPIGVVKLGSIFEDGDYIMGQMNTGELSGTPIIREIKRLIDRKRLVIIDAPPGTSCPVLESLEGSDFALLVTEPTPFGLHDLLLAVRTVRALGIPAGIVINRDTGTFKGIDELSEKEDVPVLLRIPFSKEYAILYSNGKLLTEHVPELRRAFEGLYESVKGLVK